MIWLSSCPSRLAAWDRPAWQFVVQFRPRMASAAVRAKVMVASLVRSSRLIICRKSSTGVSFLFLFLLGGAGEGGVVDLAGDLPVVLLAEQGEVVDAGGAGGVVAGQRLGAGLGVGVPGDVVRDRGPGV